MAQIKEFLSLLKVSTVMSYYMDYLAIIYYLYIILFTDYPSIIGIPIYLLPPMAIFCSILSHFTNKGDFPSKIIPLVAIGSTMAMVATVPH